MSDQPYDSTPDTVAHIERVRELMKPAWVALMNRAASHDKSKLAEPEKSIFDEATPRLRETQYGSDEYRAVLKTIKPALDHHYAKNSHHPEYWTDGVAGMTLLDLIEMVCDWKAAGDRHADGSMERSLEHNTGRFGIDDQLAAILRNTADELGLLG